MQQQNYTPRAPRQIHADPPLTLACVPATLSELERERELARLYQHIARLELALLRFTGGRA